MLYCSFFRVFIYAQLCLLYAVLLALLPVIMNKWMDERLAMYGCALSQGDLNVIVL